MGLCERVARESLHWECHHEQQIDTGCVFHGRKIILLETRHPLTAAECKEEAHRFETVMCDFIKANGQ